MADKIKILPYTLRVQMKETTIYRKAATWYEDYAKNNGVDARIVSDAIIRYAEISARVENLEGVADFELASPTDTSEEFKEKFEVYANSVQVALIETIIRKMQAMDKPVNEDFAPGKLFEGED
jgi:vacuolar-type H+-ATPase catalytic subunit A/Vma1